MNTKTEQAIERLTSCGIRPSAQRIAVMEYLLTHLTHPTADEIYTALHPELPTLSKTTVYNCLEGFVNNKAALAIRLDDHQMRYDGTLVEHGHFLCTDCGAFFDVPLKLPEALKSPAGVKVFDVQVNYRGLCAECLKKQTNN